MIVCPSISNPKPELDSSGHSVRFNLETASTEARSRKAALGKRKKEQQREREALQRQGVKAQKRKHSWWASRYSEELGDLGRPLLSHHALE